MAVPPDCRSEVRRELGLTQQDAVIACVAFHDRIKGVDVLLRAAQELAEEFPHMRILQIGGPGDPAESEPLRKLADELDLSSRVIWAGYRNDVLRVLQAADVYCQPSRSEGLPFSILEAMAVGLPVVATRVGGNGEAVVDGRTGLLVPPESPTELADALGVLLRDDPVRTAMGRAGRNRGEEKFEIGAQVGRLLDIYEKMWRDRGAW